MPPQAHAVRDFRSQKRDLLFRRSGRFSLAIKNLRMPIRRRCSALADFTLLGVVYIELDCSANHRDREGLFRMTESNVTQLLQALPQSETPPASMPKGDFQPLLDYLNTERGHEVASRLISVIESIKHSTLDKSTSNVRVEKYIQALVILAVVVATSVLVAFGKFEASVGVLFGTLVGYVFGKK